jgi:hypothetical protein
MPDAKLWHLGCILYRVTFKRVLERKKDYRSIFFKLAF